MGFIEKILSKYDKLYDDYSQKTENIREDTFEIKSLNKNKLKQTPKVIFTLISLVVVILLIMAIALLIQ